MPNARPNPPRLSPGRRSREFAVILAAIGLLHLASGHRGPPDFFPQHFRGHLKDGAVRVVPEPGLTAGFPKTDAPLLQCSAQDTPESHCHWPLPASLLLGLPVAVNELDAADFESIRGIGPTLASRLHKHRLDKGHIGSLRDFSDVHGLGPMKLNLLRQGLGERVCFESPLLHSAKPPA